MSTEIPPRRNVETLYSQFTTLLTEFTKKEPRFAQVKTNTISFPKIGVGIVSALDPVLFGIVITGNPRLAGAHITHQAIY